MLSLQQYTFKFILNYIILVHILGKIIISLNVYQKKDLINIKEKPRQNVHYVFHIVAIPVTTRPYGSLSATRMHNVIWILIVRS